MVLVNRHDEKHPFLGKVICRECGCGFWIRGWAKAKTNKQIWRCSNNLPDRNSCSNNLKLSLDAPGRAFIAAWNELVEHRDRYEPEWQRSMSSADALTRYRIQQLRQLVEETGSIDAMPYGLMLKVLDHMEVGADGRVDTIFLAGTRIETDVQ